MSADTARLEFLKGKRVSLRPILKEDIPQLLEWMNDREITQYLNAYLPVMEQEEEKWFEELSKKKETDIVFGITTKEGILIGVMGIHRISWRDRTAVTGAYIGAKEYWGKAYGTEAKMLLLDYAFNTLNLRKICSSVLAFNRRSYAYQIKCGYREEGRKRRQYYKDGRYCDEILMAVFKRDWLPLFREYKKTHLA